MPGGNNSSYILESLTALTSSGQLSPLLESLTALTGLRVSGAGLTSMRLRDAAAAQMRVLGLPGNNQLQLQFCRDAPACSISIWIVHASGILANG